MTCTEVADSAAAAAAALGESSGLLFPVSAFLKCNYTSSVCGCHGASGIKFCNESINATIIMLSVTL